MRIEHAESDEEIAATVDVDHRPDVRREPCMTTGRNVERRMGRIGGCLALLILVVASRGVEAQAPAVRDSVLRAVAADLRGNPRMAPEPAVWYVDVADSAGVAVLAAAGGTERGVRPASAVVPACPWSGVAAADSTAVGYGVTVEWQLASPDSARVTVSFRCANPPGYLHRVYYLGHTYVVVRAGAGWLARLSTISVTALPRPMPDVALQVPERSTSGPGRGRLA